MEIHEFLGVGTDRVFQSDLARTLGPRIDKRRSDRWNAKYAQVGVELSIDPRHDSVRAVFLFPAAETRPAFAGPLPSGITLADTRTTLRQKLGKPDESVEGGMSWDVWERGDYRVRAEYQKDREHLTMIVLMG